MKLKQYFRILIKRIWIVFTLLIIAVGLSAYMNFYVIKPVYESRTTLYVIHRTQPSQLLAYNDIIVGQLLVKDYRELIKSRNITSEVIEQLELKGYTPEFLASNIYISSKNDTRIIEMKVQDGNPQRAMDIADKLSRVFIQKVTELMKVENIGVVDKPTVPVNPVTPKPLKNIFTAIFAAFASALVIIYLIECLDDTVKTPEDVEHNLGMTVLGTIPVINIK
ncbi:MAG: Wzz/FepE/Etk N-terminal domain-containing protein [Clostridia bacterium]|nr:Wzz/FepE/Etk N-terminal domain-containing protein [Clostridia bacterium]